MNNPIRFALVLFTAFASLATGCAPIVVALPPPLPLPSSLLSPDQGETSVNAGARAWAVPSEEGISIIGPSDSPIGAQVERGVTEKLQLGITTNVSTFAGLYPGISAGYTLKETDRSRVGLTLNIHAAALEGSYTEVYPVVDENGTPVLDESGNQVYADEVHSYGYFSVARGLGVRGQYQLHPKVDLVYAGGVTYSSTLARYGLDANDMQQATFANASLGLVVTPVHSLHIGTTLQSLSDLSSAPDTLIGLGLSLGYTFPAR